MADETTTPVQPVLDPPNGHAVSTSELYFALYKMDLAQAERHNLAATQIEGIRTDQRQLRTEFASHTADGHPQVDHVAVVKEEIQLDAKKAGIVAGLLAVAAALIAFVKDLRPF